MDVRALLDSLCRSAGACRWGVADAAPVATADAALYDAWTARGAHGCMAYMERYADIRRDPRLLLDGARSVLVCAFSYRQPVHSVHISGYALGADYHGALRERMERVAAALREALGGDTRVCVDSAPLRERYWAVRAGVGTTGLSGRLIVPGAGADVLLAELLTTAALPPSAPLDRPLCDGCGACVASSPRAPTCTGASWAATCALPCVPHRAARPRRDVPGSSTSCTRAPKCSHSPPPMPPP